MDRLRPDTPRRSQDRFGRQIGPGRRRWAKPDRKVGLLHMGRIPVGVGVDRHGPQAQRARAPDHAAGDLASIGDQQG